MNKIFLIGRVVREPIIKNGQYGKFCLFTLATKREKSEYSDFIPVIIWHFERIKISLTKGTLISIEGKFTSSIYEKASKSMMHYEIECERLEFLESKHERWMRELKASKVLENEQINTEEDLLVALS